jgi:hypothetical protein
MDYCWWLSQIKDSILLGDHATTKGNIMYKIEIDIADWDFGSDKVTVETMDFDKISIIQEFIEFQKNHDWCVDYDVIDGYEYQCDEEEVDEDEDESDEYEESEGYEIGEIAEDEDGLVWERVA